MTITLGNNLPNSISIPMDMSSTQQPASLSDMVGGDYDDRIRNLVTYRLNCPDLQDYFEVLDGEQIHIALEGALNVIFGKPVNSVENTISGLLGTSLPPSIGLGEDVEDELTHEAQIVADVAFALTARELSVDAVVSMLETDPIEHEKYPFYESLFNSIITKLSECVANDKYNQDVVTLTGEMDFFHRIELYTYQFNTNCNVLTVTIECL